jgi:hypothetical protein
MIGLDTSTGFSIGAHVETWFVTSISQERCMTSYEAGRYAHVSIRRVVSYICPPHHMLKAANSLKRFIICHQTPR